MDPKDIEKITKNFKYLKDSFHRWDPVMYILIEKKVFIWDQKLQLNDITDPYKKFHMFIDFLTSSGKKVAFKIFIEALKDCELGFVADVLNRKPGNRPLTARREDQQRTLTRERTVERLTASNGPVFTEQQNGCSNCASANAMAQNHYKKLYAFIEEQQQEIQNLVSKRDQERQQEKDEAEKRRQQEKDEAEERRKKEKEEADQRLKQEKDEAEERRQKEKEEADQRLKQEKDEAEERRQKEKEEADQRLKQEKVEAEQRQNKLQQQVKDYNEKLQLKEEGYNEKLRLKEEGFNEKLRLKEEGFNEKLQLVHENTFKEWRKEDKTDYEKWRQEDNDKFDMRIKKIEENHVSIVEELSDKLENQIQDSNLYQEKALELESEKMKMKMSKVCIIL